MRILRFPLTAVLDKWADNSSESLAELLLSEDNGELSIRVPGSSDL